MTSNFSASIPAANMQAANDVLNNTAQTPGVKSYGPNNFSVPAYAGPSPTVALLHAWGDPVFEAAVAAIAGITITQGTDPIEMTSDAAAAAGSTWGQDALPLTGTVTPGLYKDADGVLWWVIQSYNTAVYPNPLVIPALIRVAKIPGEALPWQQPIDQYDAYKLVNPFTGAGDYALHNGRKWQVTQADGSGNNVWEPGVFGWSNIGPAPQILLNLDGDQYDDVVVTQVGNVTITEDADSYDIDLDGDGIADLHIPKP
jgi:hypothetical protein